jgi:hypothetical protein
MCIGSCDAKVGPSEIENGRHLAHMVIANPIVNY